ncbi:MAG: YeeE/YedE family protein [Gammaproteobacteria bacterium]|nr:YeeE/YedE family protein [Gammaproteobacteria bacterium]
MTKQVDTLQIKTLNAVSQPDKKGRMYAMSILAVITLGSIFALMLDTRFVYLLVYLWFGTIYGLLLQYGRFCMASAVRDLFAVGVPRMAVGVMIAVALYSLTAAAVTAGGLTTYHPHPLGWHVVIGGALFGFGIVFTGGCASGSLYKSGEGNMGSMLVVVTISFAQAYFVDVGGIFNHMVPEAWTASAAAKDMPAEISVTNGWFDQFMAGHVWDMHAQTVAGSLGIKSPVAGAFLGNALLCAILPTLAILVLLYMRVYRKGYLRRAKITAPRFGDHVRGMWSMITSSRNTALAGLALGIFAGMHMWVIGELREHYNIFNFGELLRAMGYTHGLSIQDTVFDPGYWYITTQEAQWGGWLMEKLGINMMGNIFFGVENGLPNPLINAPGYMSIGIILGAAVLANLRGEFKWKIPNLETAIMAVVGGIFMGLGARVGLGCNIGAFFAPVTNGDVSGWIFLAGMLLGAFGGVKLINWWIDWRASRQDEFAL